MQTISQLYDEYLHKRNRTWLIKANIAGTDYGSDVIVDFSIETSVSSGEELELGTANIAKFVLRVKNTIDVPPNARIVPYLALQLPDSLNGADVAWQDADIAWEDADFPWQGSVTEWLPLGEFFVDTRAVIQGNILELTCADRLRFADVAYVSGLSYPASMQAVWDEICGLVGYSYGDTVQINPSYQIEAGPAGYTARQVLGYIAGLHGACVVVDRWGLIQWRQFSAADEPVSVFTSADYFKVTQTNPEKTYTRLVVIYNSDDGLAFERGSGDENHTLTIENPFATPTMVDDLHARLNGFSYTPVQMDARGYPQFDAGDRVRFGTPAAELTWDTADVAWQDADITWDGYDGSRPNGTTLLLHLTYTFKGGLKMSFEAPSKSEQQSEYQVQGSLSAALDRLRATAVREGRSYFGVSISRNDGMIIEREDHLSRLVLNSDKMAWQVGSEDRLYYDAQADELAFTGNITMKGGSINWSSVGAPDIDDIEDLSGRLTYIGPTGIYTGTIKTDQLIAGTAKISSALIESLVVGDNVIMGPNATISWHQVTDQPNIPVLPSYIHSTYIDSTNVISPNITGGVITGGTIQTSSTGTYPRIELNSSARLLRAEQSATNYLEISPSVSGSPSILFDSATIRGQIGPVFGGLSLITDAGKGNINIMSGADTYISGDYITLNGIRVDVPGWASVNSLGNGQTLQAALDSKAPIGQSAVIGVVTGFNGSNPVYAILYFTNGALTNVVT